jgi:6-phosphogluconate dehydrogenase
MLRIGRLLHAERTADAISQHPDLVAPDAEHLGDVVAKPEYALAADIKGPVSALRIVLRVRRARLPGNLIQAQRDFFGAHTYERIDKPGIFHTDWIGDQPAQEITEPKPTSKRHAGE